MEIWETEKYKIRYYTYDLNIGLLNKFNEDTGYKFRIYSSKDLYIKKIQISLKKIVRAMVEAKDGQFEL